MLFITGIIFIYTDLKDPIIYAENVTSLLEAEIRSTNDVQLKGFIEYKKPVLLTITRTPVVKRSR